MAGGVFYHGLIFLIPRLDLLSMKFIACVWGQRAVSGGSWSWNYAEW